VNDPRAAAGDVSGEGLLERLRAAGMGELAARGKAQLLERCASLLRLEHGGADPGLFYVPGRVEVLGKHTDYAGGRSLLMAAERGLCAAASPRADPLLRLLNADDGSAVEFRIEADLQPRPGHWFNYAMTVARRLAGNFTGPLLGADVVFASDLPPAAGMSSSSAMIVLWYLVLEAANRLGEREEYRRCINSDEALAGYLACIENGQSFGELAGDRGVGTFGGSEDHTAILCCRPGQLSQYAFCPVRLERRVAFPAGHVMAIGVSGVRAEKTGAAQAGYNRISRLAAAMVEALEGGHSTLAEALGACGLEEARRRLLQAGGDPAPMLARLEQFFQENQRIIPGAGDALEQGDVESLAALAAWSQALAEHGLGNQVAETIFLARSARGCGARAASAFGAGFGGSVWALVEAREAKAFLGRWSSAYLNAFADRAQSASFFTTGAGPPALRLG
jgi:galactokinase